MKLPSPALIVAAAALFISLGGVAGAATTLITTKMLQDNSVTRAKIAINSVNSAKIEDGSIQSQDLSGTIRGERGPAGVKGADGDAGPRGPAGVKGADGDAGPRGPAGVKGADGDAGARGPAGTNGTAGSNGTNGSNGAPGADGTNGTNGAPGADGRTVLNGSGAPSSGTGANGDYYIDNTAHAIYGPKVAGAWGSSTNLIGPTGPQGEPGAIAQAWNPCIPSLRGGTGGMRCLGPYRNYTGTTWFGGGTEFCDVIWTSSDFQGVDFTGSTRLASGTLTGVNFSNAIFTDATIRGVCSLSAAATGATFDGATMIRVNAVSVNFNAATFVNANLTSADLSGANFTGANLAGANLTGANIDSVVWSNATCPNGTSAGSGAGATCVGKGV